MDNGFFRSKHFFIAALIAVVIVAAAAGAYAVGGRVLGVGEPGCDAPLVGGRDVTPTVAVETASGGRERRETYAFDAGSLAAGSLDLCVSVGEVYVEPSAGTQVELAFTITSTYPDAVERTIVDATFADDNGRLHIAAWEPQRGEAAGAFMGQRSAEVRLVLRVPDSGAWDVTGRGDVADVRVNGIRVSGLDLSTDVGNAFALGVHLEGNATARSEVGDVILSLASVQSGRIEATSEVGEVEIELPQRADVGYDVTGTSEVGAVTLRLGSVEVTESEDDGPGATKHQRTTGFGTKPTQVTVRGTSEVGDVTVTTQAA